MLMDSATVPSNVRDREIERMMLQYGDSIYRICYAYLCDRQLAEDAGQETFIKAYKSLDKLSGQIEAYEKAWLTRIAINTCKDIKRGAWLRRLDRSVSAEQALQNVGVTDSKEGSLAAEVMRLPHKLKEAVLLHYYQELTYDEVCDILRISKSALYERLKRARMRLKNELERWY